MRSMWDVCVCVCVPVWIPMWPGEFALRVVQLQQRAVRRLVTSQFCLTREQADARKAGPESRTKKSVNRSKRSTKRELGLEIFVLQGLQQTPSTGLQYPSSNHSHG